MSATLHPSPCSSLEGDTVIQPRSESQFHSLAVCAGHHNISLSLACQMIAISPIEVLCPEVGPFTFPGSAHSLK